MVLFFFIKKDETRNMKVKTRRRDKNITRQLETWGLYVLYIIYRIGKKKDLEITFCFLPNWNI